MALLKAIFQKQRAESFHVSLTIKTWACTFWNTESTRDVRTAKGNDCFCSTGSYTD